MQYIEFVQVFTGKDKVPIKSPKWLSQAIQLYHTAHGKGRGLTAMQLLASSSCCHSTVKQHEQRAYFRVLIDKTVVCWGWKWKGCDGSKSKILLN